MSANVIREFLAGLMRDQEAAASYHADPEQALAAAGLAAVTPEDIAAVTPLLAESALVAEPATASAWAAVDVAEVFGGSAVEAPDHPR
ncbi:IniB N-terminal domain-containing protein [Nocardia mexicana]|uniref:Uncharacterized protein n=1 Tax=Nocardia mexicana TaxID=279262 RepID=A0A370GT78_9NOCA|nr:IniB N-terminal domain-containing protein [Nocardia mexicana]RDI46679.1 hypothetical protein DFR68_11084 [Nocardia mexicana]